MTREQFNSDDELMQRWAEIERIQNARYAEENKISDDDRRFSNRRQVRVNDCDYQVTTSTKGKDFVGYPSKEPISIPKLDGTKVGIAIVAAFAIAGLGYVTGLSVHQAQVFQEQTAIEQTVDLPNQVYNNVDLDIQSNGEALFVDQDGNRFAYYNGEDANDIADRYTNQNSAPTK